MTEQACSNCKFSQFQDRGCDRPLVICRRYPPQIIQEASVTSSVFQNINHGAFPVLTGDNWCGEHQPK